MYKQLEYCYIVCYHYLDTVYQTGPELCPLFVRFAGYPSKQTFPNET